MKTVDARGLPCPQPVLLTKKAIEEGENEIEVLVSGDAPKENIKKLCSRYQCEIEEAKTSDGWRLVIRQKGAPREHQEESKPATPQTGAPVTLLITCNKIGENEELGKILMEGFINTLPSATNKPQCILFMNEGVFLTTEGSPVLSALKQLEEMGVEIRSCGTCLDFYNLKDKLRVGVITNMYDTVEALTSGHIITKI